MNEARLATGSIYLGRYANRLINDDLFYPCAVSLGKPKFKTAYAIVDELDSAKPPRETWEEIRENGWTAKAEADLEKYFQDRSRAIDAALRTIVFAAKTFKKDPVLLCFENVCAASEKCHRTIFAGVMRRLYGWSFVELPDVNR